MQAAKVFAHIQEEEDEEYIELRKFFMRLKMIRMSFVFRHSTNVRTTTVVEFSHQFNVKLKWNYDKSISLWHNNGQICEGRISTHFIIIFHITIVEIIFVYDVIKHLDIHILVGRSSVCLMHS